MLYLEDVGLVYDRGLPGARVALRGVTLAVGRGERVGLGGPSGSGKSSLLLVAAGLYPPSSGRIRRAGGRVGLVLQEPEMALFAPTVYEEVAFTPRAMGWGEEAVREAVSSSLAAVGLGEEILGADPLALPIDGQRLVAVAAVLAGRPELLLLDEPTAGLSPPARARLVELVRGFPGTLLIASHDLDFLWRTCPRLVVLANGTVAADGRWEEFILRPEVLTGVGLTLPPVPAVLAGLRRRGWELAVTAREEEAVADQILAGRPGGGKG